MRAHRQDWPDARHHVYNRGRRREPIFEGEDARGLFLSLLSRLPDRYGIRIHGFALMPNHYHLLLQSDGNLSRAMQWFGGEFVRRLNSRRSGWDGSIYKGRFQNEVVREDAYWRYLLAYVHLNPVRAGLAPDAAAAPWTSYLDYVERSRKRSWLHTDEQLALHGSTSNLVDFHQLVQTARDHGPLGVPSTDHEHAVRLSLAGATVPQIAHALQRPASSVRRWVNTPPRKPSWKPCAFADPADVRPPTPPSPAASPSAKDGRCDEPGSVRSRSSHEPVSDSRTPMKLTGRILHLVDDAATVQAQLDGSDAEPGPEDDYVYGVNTDAIISGRACTLGYTPEVLGPYFLENFLDTVEESAIADGGFQVVVGGHAYGSGSSREVAVVAHEGAGIELVVADSFQRIFQENMVYSGMPFTTDRTVLERLQAGEDVDLDALSADLPPFFRAVAEAGGLMKYGTQLMAGAIEPTYETSPAPRPMNIAEKIIAARTWTGGEDGIPSVRPGDQVLARCGFRGMHEYTTGMVVALYQDEWGAEPMYEPELVAAFEDHFVLISHEAVPDAAKKARLAPAMRLTDEMVEAAKANGIRLHGPGRDLPPGVCHRVVVEQYAEPGDIVVLTDSHSPTAGVLNAFAFGVGSTAMAFALRTGLIPVTVPKVVRVEVTGTPSGGLSPKDLILHLIGDPYFREEHWRELPTDTCIIEFGGPGLEQWDVDELSVLTNMTVEGGLMTGVVEPNDAIVAFLKARRGIDLSDKLVQADDGAEYARVLKVDLAEVPLTIATPGDSRNRAPLDDHTDVRVDNVVIASCTGGSLADLRAAANVLRGRDLASGVRLTVTPSSTLVAQQAEEEGLLNLFRKIGAIVTEPGCGSCIGNGPGIPLPGETTASTTNRNFARRMGAPGPVYLVSPAVAAASAITGKLTDPRHAQD